MTNQQQIGPAEDLATAIADQLTELGFEASRRYYPIITSGDYTSVKIYVRPDGDVAELQTRETNRHQVSVTIMVIKNLRDPDDVTEFDGVARTVEDIKVLWENPALASELGANCGVLRHKRLNGLAWAGKLANEPLFDQEQVHYENRIVSQISLTYFGTR